MLPLVARTELRVNAFQYGVLLGCLGAGAVAGVFVIAWARRNVSTNLLVVSGTVVFSIATAALGYLTNYALLCVALLLGGVAWMTTMSSFNVSVQTVVPEWVRARALALYLLVFFGSLAAGGATGGAAGARVGVE